MPWDSCFGDVFVTPGLQTLAETGKTNVLEKELADFIDMGKAYDGVIGAPISDGRLTRGEGRKLQVASLA